MKKAVARLTRLTCALAATAPVLPSPGSANTQSSFDPVVRVEGAAPSTGGTGTLIGTRQVGDSYGMVFLAADHTLERVGPLATIGFGDVGSPKLELSLGGAVDLTVGVTAAPSPYAPFTIQAFGFGKSGPIVTYGTQQSFDNVIDSYLSFNGSYTTDMNNNPLVYVQEMERWTYNDPNTGTGFPARARATAASRGRR